MLEALKVIILGIVEGITEWLPISSTGHLILVEEFVKLNFSQSYLDMFNVVIQLGAIMAVVVIYFHRLNPFSPKKTEKQKRMTLQLWVKVVIASIPAGVVGVLFNDFIEEKFNNSYVVATMLIVVGVLFIVTENRHKGRKPQITKISQMGVPVLIWIGVFQMLAMIPGTSRSGATIVGALALGVSRTAAADFTFFLAIPAMAGASLVKLRHFGFDFTGTELGLLLLGCVVSFVVSILAIKFLLKYIQNHDFKAFGYYRIVLGIIVFLYFGIHALLA
ncbi:undecaprenyl-diphosphate phosphatase [Mediterraneibacter gnavus]|uniref:undecaprenyl-diphosphate phosphatase n=1 Tax=Mediterraneibacter gnavus TaxID=33038 RepID=UPI00228561D6|nr:undecaprenyl-diphosphate phosphatase [Mediterraneibacter gnavus]MCZ0656076.1 undecaprenyl-diphosphate phosphatase [Mediterraneibacter gnavus]